MQDTIIDYIEHLQITEPTVCDRLCVFPLCADPADDVDCLLLDEALEQELVKVTEVDESGSVPTLKLFNRAGRKILIFSGEELVGAKQNRVVNTTILVDKNKKIDIPVSCVEAHRWSDSPEGFGAGKKAMPAGMRFGMARAVKGTLVTMGSFTGSQRQVWVDIDTMMGDMKVNSKTAAMADIFDQKAKPLEEVVKGFAATEKQVGLLAAIDGRIVGCDCFDSNRILKKVYAKLVRSYAIDALAPQAVEAGVQPSIKDAEAFLKTVQTAQATVNDSVDLGKDLRFESKEVIGSSLVFDSHVMHLALFAA